MAGGHGVQRGLIAALLGLVLVPWPLAAQRREVLRTPIRVVDDARAVLPVMVGTSGPFWLILDSGFGYDAILLFDTTGVDFQGFHHLSVGRVPGAGGGEPSTVLFSDSGSFRIGDLRFDNHRVIMMTNRLFNWSRNQGAVGHSLLGHYAVELDYDDSLMILYDAATFEPAAGWTGIDLTFPQRPVPWVKITVQTGQEPPVEIDTYIDFASREAVELLDRPTNRWTMPALSAERVIGTGLSGDVVGRTGRMAAVTIGPFTLRDVVVQVTPAGVRQGSESGADAVIASGLLRRFNLVFDYAHRKLWLRPNRAFAQPF